MNQSRHTFDDVMEYVDSLLYLHQKRAEAAALTSNLAGIPAHTRPIATPEELFEVLVLFLSAAADLPLDYFGDKVREVFEPISPFGPDYPDVPEYEPRQRKYVVHQGTHFIIASRLEYAIRVAYFDHFGNATTIDPVELGMDGRYLVRLVKWLSEQQAPPQERKAPRPQRVDNTGHTVIEHMDPVAEAINRGRKLTPYERYQELLVRDPAGARRVRQRAERDYRMVHGRYPEPGDDDFYILAEHFDEGDPTRTYYQDDL